MSDLFIKSVKVGGSHGRKVVVEREGLAMAITLDTKERGGLKLATAEQKAMAKVAAAFLKDKAVDWGFETFALRKVRVEGSPVKDPEYMLVADISFVANEKDEMHLAYEMVRTERLLRKPNDIRLAIKGLDITGTAEVAIEGWHSAVIEILQAAERQGKLFGTPIAEGGDPAEGADEPATGEGEVRVQIVSGDGKAKTEPMPVSEFVKTPQKVKEVQKQTGKTIAEIAADEAMAAVKQREAEVKKEGVSLPTQTPEATLNKLKASGAKMKGETNAGGV